MTTYKEELKSLVSSIRDEWLEQNCVTQKDKVPYGDTEVVIDCGYSDRDWLKATQAACDEITGYISEIINEK